MGIDPEGEDSLYSPMVKQKRIVQSSDEQWVLYLLSVCHHVPDLYKSDAVAEGKEGREKTLVPGQVSRGDSSSVTP
eukprot:scaffold17065_cov85-Skeletonema_dohrnii-CCMP3373.AAC.1